MADDPTREDRLARALRDNLRRRKAQARAADATSCPKPPGPEGGAGEAEAAGR